jgi:hypothetical protein
MPKEGIELYTESNYIRAYTVVLVTFVFANCYCATHDVCKQLCERHSGVDHYAEMHLCSVQHVKPNRIEGRNTQYLLRPLLLQTRHKSVSILT